MTVSHYRNAQKRIKRRLEEGPFPVIQQMLLLAVGRECDRLGVEQLPLDEDKLLELVNEELLRQTVQVARRMMILTGMSKPTKDEALEMIHYSTVIKGGFDGLEDFYVKTLREYKKLRRMEPHKRRKHIEERRAALAQEKGKIIGHA